MATTASPCVRSFTIERCTTERSWFVTDMAARGNTLAVSGYDCRTYTQSFIDLFTLNDPGSSPFRTHLFPKPSDHPRWRHRRVSFLDDSRIVTVCDDLVKVYHIKADLSELSRTVNLLQYTPVKCMTVREEEIFIGWYESKEVIVFDFNLNEIKTITLEGLEGYPVDITVNGDNLFISTYLKTRSRATCIRYNMEGKIVHEYKAPGYSDAWSITVSGLVYILWDDLHVVVYSLSDSQQLMSFNVDESHTIRIVDVNRLLTVNRRAGEVREYSMTQLCTFENLKRTLCRVMSPIDCAELKRFFKITDLDMSTNGNESRDIVAGAQDDRAAHLLAILETKGFIGSDNLDGLKKAFQHLGTAHVSMLRSQLESFQLHSKPSEEHSDSQSTPGQDPHIWKSLNRFSTRGKWKIDDLAVEVSGKIIVSGHGIQDGRIFLDTISPKTVREECSADIIYEGNAYNKNCDDDNSETSRFHSMYDYSDRKHFTSIIDESRIVSCQGKTLKILNLKNNTEDPSITLNGIVSCVEVRGSDILVGYTSYSPDPRFPCIDVFDSALRKKCSIKLKLYSASIIDLSLLAGKLLVFTCQMFKMDVCLFDGDSGNMLLKFSLPTRTAGEAKSVAVNDTHQMVAILWSGRWDEDGTYLSFHLVDSGLCLCWAEVNQACKLRFMNSVELVLVSSTGQISSYKKTYFFSYNNLIDPVLESLASEEGCNILWQFFAVSADERTKVIEDDDYDDEDEYYSKKLAKRFMAFLHKKIVSPSQRFAALLKASWELERYHAFALSARIDYYKCLSSGSGNYNDQPYQLLHYYESSVPLGETAATQIQIQSVDEVPGTSNSSPSMPVPSQSEIRSNGPSTFYPASTNNSAPKRRAPPYSGTNVEPHSKRKNTSSSELEQEDSTSGNTTLQFEIFQQSNPAPNQLVSITSTIPNRGGNPFAKGFVAALNDLPQTSQSLTTSLPMTQLEKQSPSNRQVIPSERSDSSRQIDSLTAQVRSVHELQSGTSSDTLAGGQHLQPEPSISEPSSSQVGGPSNYRPPREVDRSVIIGESRLVLQESSVEPELTAQEDYDSSAPSAWRGGSTSGDIRGLLQTPLSTSEGQAGLSIPLMPSSEQMETLRPNVLTDPSEETTELPGVQTNAELAKMNEQINQVYSLLTDISQRLPPGLRDSSSSLGESSRSSQLPRCHPSTSADPLSSLQDHEKQAILVYKDKTDDRVALVKELVPIFFTEEERRTQNCQGKGLCDGKDEFTQLSKEKLQKMREIIFYLCPVRSIKERETVEEKEWKRLCSEIDLFNRHFRGNLTRQAKSKSKRRKSDK